MAPSKMKAIKVVEKGRAEIQEVPVPKLREEYVLVKTTYVALNPTDWYSLLSDTGVASSVAYQAVGNILTISPYPGTRWAATLRVSSKRSALRSPKNGRKGTAFLASHTGLIRLSQKTVLLRNTWWQRGIWQ